ncbi:hypothetical protein SARC_14340 [Sphaeroforma arctica JP610]|uniref:Tyrosine specific protein phosphatases domain-containing protein n=1 Tax=Sphaeroforma arctica JP610 TaxID=667725 RepID=A0A0L0F8R7_9EUKA|nr:hypothetical protein SARC_14340 [Sphaeroforma arctica JP610]KNC73102.1 hypothetical protein SARC_14340 [Sphaeroforma arctica JP610]|eukprot:XP_014147004.1 hypothetical protein SARC_14340 [Sphaeroforma arctica JP610]
MVRTSLGASSLSLVAYYFNATTASIVLAGCACAVELLNSLIHKGGLLVKDVDPKALVVHLPSVSTDNIIQLKGVINFRGLAGIPTRDGLRIKKQVLYRSAHLARIKEEDIDTLIALNIGTVVDLRSKREKTKLPDDLTKISARDSTLTGVEDKLTLWASMIQLRDVVNLLLFNRHRIQPSLGEYYIDIVDNMVVELFGQFLVLLSDKDNLACVVHCTAGKDRTGIFVALLLTLLNVEEEVIISEYSLTNLDFDRSFRGFCKGSSLKGYGIPDAQMKGSMVAEPQWMRNLLQHMKDKYGSVEGYVLNECGVDPEVLAKVRANLLEKPE